MPRRFLHAVVHQVANPLGSVEAPCAERERRTEARVRALLARAAEGDEGRRAAARELAEDAVLLSAFFQNLDLLESGAAADVAALLTAEALATLPDRDQAA
ncbi:MAG TPA: hypothetical protein VFY16_14185 [Gemmatimonadaceae bacterium]|nr:hypothetical protein [Gemmatimonadaceae bacterium]